MNKRKPITRNSTPKQIYNYLVSNYPSMPVAFIHARIDALKEKRRANNQKKQLRVRLKTEWAVVLTPLRDTIQSIITHQHLYEEANPAYYKFNIKYLALLRALRDELKDKEKNNVSPKPNATWVDYVPDEVKDKVKEKYNTLPRTSPHTVYREIFKSPNVLSRNKQSQRNKLNDHIDRMINEMGRGVASGIHANYYEMNLRFYEEALRRLNNLPFKKAIPKSVEGLFSVEELLQYGYVSSI